MLERTERVHFRVTPEEKRMLMDKAAKAGLTLTGFLLWEALGEEIGQCILDSFKSPTSTRKASGPVSASGKVKASW